MMAVLVDDPVFIASVRLLAAQMRCTEEEAIGYAVATELGLLDAVEASVIERHQGENIAAAQIELHKSDG
jgi:hypothetical protein